MEIRDVHSTDLFTGSLSNPHQVLRVTLVNRGDWRAGVGDVVTVRGDGPGITVPEPVTVTGLGPGEERTVEVPLAVDPTHPEGATRPVTVVAEGADRSVRVDGEVTVAAPGWTMFLVPHFHYDPVWWNSQAGYLATWDDLPPVAQRRRSPAQRTADELVRAHLDAARRDPDYKFVLAELDYLKPYWDSHPEDRAELRRLIADGRVELVGGMSNEPNTNLTSLEATIRNVIYGVGYQRDVIGGDPRTGWMLDVFGHDPSYPAVLADAALTASAWARGPFHQWGPWRTAGTNTVMQFPSEFEWLAPDGRGVLTGYMPNHYSAGWGMASLATLAEAEAEAYAQFQALKPVAATRNVLLPVGADHVIPCRWATEIGRDWNKRYTWPRFVVGLPAEFFAAVRADTRRQHRPLSPQSRDMNPIYTGKDVSYIDTKQAHRAAEVALVDGEKLATLMTPLGARFPAEAVDKAWRQLCFNAHHDGITGTESDQVYLDLLGGWREAYELGTHVRAEAIGYLAEHVDTRGEGQPLLVVNTLSWPRSDVATVTVRFPAPGPAGVEVRGDDGAPVPVVAEAVRHHRDGTLAAVRLSFVARDVPATGYRTYRVMPTRQPLACTWRPVPAHRAESDRFLVEADPGRGGGLCSIIDKRTGRQLLRDGAIGGELICHDEYPEHPTFGEGPWHLAPTGARHGTATVPGQVRAETAPAAQRLVTSCRLGGLAITSEVIAWNGLDRLEMRTHVDGSIGRDRLLRVRFPLAVAGARPVYETAAAVVGRPFGFPDVDAAQHPWTLDNPAYTWVGLSSTARVALRHGSTVRVRHAIGVAEIIADDTAAGLRDLVAALAAQGVTATVSRPDGPRYGSLAVDSNLPDVRVSIGAPDRNPFTARVLDAAGPAYAERLTGQLAATGRARLWIPPTRGRSATWAPGADVRGVRDLPVLVVAGGDPAATAAAVADLAADLADATIDVDQPTDLDGATDPLDDYSIAVLNRGIPGAVVEPSGTVHLSLMRACSGWPSGVWTEPPRRTAPDGSSFAWQHWSHTFEYAITSGPGDWRAAGFVTAGRGYNHRLETRLVDPHPGELPATASLLAVEPATVVATAVKPAGNPLAAGRSATRTRGITVRCQETRGIPTRARVRCVVPLRDAASTDVLEQRHTLLNTRDGVIDVEVGPMQTVTVTATPDTPPRDAGPVLGPHSEPAQPVHTRYWLHNKGAAPVGYLPVSVHVDPQSIRLTGPTRLRITVSTIRDAAGHVELVVPPALRATVTDAAEAATPDRPAAAAPPGELDTGHLLLRYHIPAGGYRRFDLVVQPTGDARPGVYHVAARIVDDLGQTLEDVATVQVPRPVEEANSPASAARDPAADTAPADEPATGDAVGDDLDVHVDTPAVTVPVGGDAKLRIRVGNRCHDEVRGEAQLISPFGTWDLADPWTRGFAVPPGGQVVLDYRVHAGFDARPMTAWALVKVMAAGRARYTPSIPVTVTPAEPSPSTPQ